MDVITKGSEASAIIQCGGIWFAGGKFGVTLKAFQIVTTPKARLESGVCYLPLVSAPRVSSEAAPSQPVSQAEAATKVESDDEIDPDAEYSKPPEPEVEAAPTPEGTAEQPPAPVKGRKKVVKTEA